VDGEEIGAIPDSVEYHIRVSEADASEGETISSIADLEAGIDWNAINDPTMREGYSSGEDFAEFSGDDGFEANTPKSDFIFLSDGTEYAVLTVYDIESVDSGDNSLFTTTDGTGSNHGIQLSYRDQSGWGERVQVANGSDQAIDISDDGVESGVAIHEFELGSDEGFLRVNNNLRGTDSRDEGNFSSGEPEETAGIGNSSAGGRGIEDAHFAEAIVLKDPETGDVDQARDFLASRYDIDLE